MKNGSYPVLFGNLFCGGPVTVREVSTFCLIEVNVTPKFAVSKSTCGLRFELEHYF